jgi:glycosyltransferase involved in cell wall biosynthesis
MRIAYVCADDGVPVFGHKGCSIHVQEVLGALRGTGADLSLFAARLGGAPPPRLAGIPIQRLPRPYSEERSTREWEAVHANHALREALVAGGPFDAVYERYALWSFAGMEYARDNGAAGLLEVNAPLIEEQAAHRGLVHREVAELVTDRVFTAASRLIAVSQPLGMSLPGEARGRVRVIPNAIDPDRFPADVRPTRPMAGTFTIGFLGGLRPWHGLSLLAEAFARLVARVPNSRLLVVGDGPERRAFESALASYWVRDLADLTGAVAPDEVPGLLASMDAAVAPYDPHPSFYFSPLKIYEYMAAGLPVVASRVGQIPETIRHGETGLLCPAGDAAAIAETLERLAHDPGLRTRLGKDARRLVLADHTWGAVAGRILALADESLRERRDRTSGAVGTAGGGPVGAAVGGI